MKIYKTSVNWVLTKANRSFSQTAYMNLFKWRTVKVVSGRQWTELYNKSWNDTQNQIQELKPGLIVLLGKGVGDEFKKRYTDDAKQVVIYRCIGDSYLVEQLPSTEEALVNFGKRSIVK